MIRATVKQKFAEQFTLTRYGVKWFDLVGITQIDAQRVARLEVSDRGYSDHYGHIEVTIANRVTGTIDVKSFRFNDYLPFDMKDRTDARKDYDGGFYGWTDNGTLDWYIAKPKSLAPLMLAIQDYIDAWK